MEAVGICLQPEGVQDHSELNGAGTAARAATAAVAVASSPPLLRDPRARRVAVIAMVKGGAQDS